MSHSIYFETLLASLYIVEKARSMRKQMDRCRPAWHGGCTLLLFPVAHFWKDARRVRLPFPIQGRYFVIHFTYT